MPKSEVVVSALLERSRNGKKQLYVQDRHKPTISPNYVDMLEIPAGGIHPYENVFEAVRREVLEETGLKVVRFVDEESTVEMENRKGDSSIAFRPYLCQQVLSTNGGLPWYGFVFRCEVQGDININRNEVANPRWLYLDELTQFLESYPEKIFSLQYATLKKYLEEFVNIPQK
jgi:8-oxo-dGTP pyrophosphatase MutT (NUDIX family)